MIALAAIAVATAFNSGDRMLLTIVQEPLRAEFGVSDGALGLLGFFFAIGYVASSFPLAALADRGRARGVITWTFVWWSALTVACGFATTFLMLLVFRVGVALGEAGSGPAGHGLVARSFPAANRTVALSTLIVATILGISGATAAGGWIAQNWGWRSTFLVFGAAGLALAPVVWLCLHGLKATEVPASGDAAPTVRQNLPAVLLSFWRRKSLRYITLAAILKTIGANGLAFWVASFLIRKHHLSVAEAGLAISIATLVGGCLGALGLGVLVDKIARRDERAFAAVPALVMFVGGLVGLTFVWSPNPTVAIASYALLQFVILGVAPPIYALVQRLAAEGARASAAAFIILCISTFGQAVGPPLVGFASDAAKRLGYTEPLQVAMTIGGTTMLLAAAAAALSVFYLRSDIADQDRESAAD